MRGNHRALASVPITLSAECGMTLSARRTGPESKVVTITSSHIEYEGETWHYPNINGPGMPALATRFERLVRDGEATDYEELARLGHVSRARITQIMNLLLLAPEIQEQILFLPRVERGDDPTPMRQLQRIALVPDWKRQQRLWMELMIGLCASESP